MRTERVIAQHGNREVAPDPECYAAFAEQMAKVSSPEELLSRFSQGLTPLDGLLRLTAWKAICKRLGSGARIAPQAGCLHPETFEIGDGFFLGTGAFLQGRFQGRCRIGDHVWVGPHCYFDARDLEIGDFVGWGPGSKVLGSEHTGEPLDVPIVSTDLLIKPVVVKDWADIGTGAILLPGVTVGKGAMVGAGAVVTRDVADFSVVAGVPARFVRWRNADTPNEPSGKIQEELE